MTTGRQKISRSQSDFQLAVSFPIEFSCGKMAVNARNLPPSLFLSASLFPLFSFLSPYLFPSLLTSLLLSLPLFFFLFSLSIFLPPCSFLSPFFLLPENRQVAQGIAVKWLGSYQGTLKIRITWLSTSEADKCFPNCILSWVMNPGVLKFSSYEVSWFKNCSSISPSWRFQIWEC